MENDINDHGEILAKWNFAEFEKNERSKAWYTAFFIVVILLLIYSLVTINFLFAVIIIIGAITLIMRDRHEPDQITFTITEDGIEIDNKFHEFDTINYFYMIYKPPEVKSLYIEFKSILKPRLIIPLENQNPLQIRNILEQYLDENFDREEEPASEAFRKTFKL